MDISTLIFILQEIRGEYGELNITLGYDEDPLTAEDIILKPEAHPASVNVYKEEY